jgi:hypothetical protein
MQLDLFDDFELPEPELEWEDLEPFCGPEYWMFLQELEDS